jgi:hydrogenase/urease accessory protein HupE
MGGGGETEVRDGLLFAIVVALTWFATPANAHEVRPGYLEVKELSDGAYDIVWKVPARGDMRLGLYVRLPEACEGAPASAAFVSGAYVERWRADCQGGLTGKHIEIDGLSSTRTDVLARVQRLDGTTQTERLTPERTSFEVVNSPSRLQVVRTYFGLGVEHILLGIDHLLFVLALLFLVGNWKKLIATVTAFTVAHSITLAAATLGFVNVPQTPVEAVIALSVVFVAVEIIHVSRGKPSLTARKPWLVAFVFGLLHGFGFAGALRAVGLPQKDIPLALLFFNVGVEVGQIIFIVAVVASLSLLSRLLPTNANAEVGPWRAESLMRKPVAYLVGSMAAFWLVQRVVGFWV